MYSLDTLHSKKIRYSLLIEWVFKLNCWISIQARNFFIIKFLIFWCAWVWLRVYHMQQFQYKMQKNMQCDLAWNYYTKMVFLRERFEGVFSYNKIIDLLNNCYNKTKLFGWGNFVVLFIHLCNTKSLQYK